MEKARSNTELYSNQKTSLNNVKPSNFWGHITIDYTVLQIIEIQTVARSSLMSVLALH